MMSRWKVKARSLHTVDVIEELRGLINMHRRFKVLEKYNSVSKQRGRLLNFRNPCSLDQFLKSLRC